MKKFSFAVAYAAVVVCALIPLHRTRAQVATSTSPRTAWTTSTNYLGIDNFECDCTLSFGSATTPRYFEFRSEPVVLGVMRPGPSYGKLRRGDVITHVYGQSLLTSEGGRRFASIDPGDDVDLTVRRSGRTMKVRIHAQDISQSGFTVGAGMTAYGIGWEDAPPTPVTAPSPPRAGHPGYTPLPPTPVMPATPATPSPGAYPVEPAQPSHPSHPSVPSQPSGVWAITTPSVGAVGTVPRGWFGFSIRCNGCGWSTSSSDASPVWEAEEVPVLSRVDAESPAGRAGLRAGDRITHIDGLSLMSREGGRRFGRVRPGQRVRLTVKRGNTTLHPVLVVGTRPEMRAAIASVAPRTPRTPPTPSTRRQLRYTGQLDNVSVEVWSAGGPTVDKIGDTMVITVGTSVVRIKVDPKKSPE